MPGIDCFVCRMEKRGIRCRWDFLLTMAFFIIHSSFTVSALIDIKPLAQVTLVGSRVRMECTIDSSSQAVDWEFAPADSDDFSFIYTARQVPTSLASRYKIDTDGEGQYDIVIDSVDSSHAGTYICTPVNGGGASSQTSASAQLIVLESDPVCGTNASASNVEGDYVGMWCTVKYTGNWLPVMDWYSIMGGYRVRHTSKMTAGMSSITLQLSSASDGFTCTCKTSFNPWSPKLIRYVRRGETPAENVPDYQFVWPFTARVFYAPRDLTITPMQDKYEWGDLLVCSAKGNPTPSYEWTEMETNRTAYGSDIILGKHLKYERQVFRCTAYNMVADTRREIAETIAFRVYMSVATETDISTPLDGIELSRLWKLLRLGFKVLGYLSLLGGALGFGIAVCKKVINRNKSPELQVDEMVPKVDDDGDLSDGIKVESTKISKSACSVEGDVGNSLLTDKTFAEHAPTERV